MNKKRGLGKGLEALLPVNQETDSNVKLREIKISDVVPNTKQPRKLMDEDKLLELAESIKEHGVVQPIVVRPLGGGDYELIAGERRWRACLRLGLEKIPAIIREYDDLEATAVALIENIQRENLNPMEEAMAYKVLMDDFGLTQEDVSKRVGKSRPFVGNMVRLLSLPLDIKNMIVDGSITAGHARAMLSIEDHKQQLKIAQKIMDKQLNVRQTEKLVKTVAERQKTIRRQGRKSYMIKDLEEQLFNILATKIKISSDEGGGGKIVIYYSGEDDLKWLVKVITGQEEVM
ncbi:chromosome partitioning protein ParB [Desulfocucumis palustris]|uniref:Chromosome partitioning protein ParB n=1 Tax=Desulfocucumis palustris TaxID=1898651 RepID=A0A2L2X906_9FIRM|nr:ParB/RepB/Spo0J family partition protein [Desulfocucumis palustris]GBF32502.1 chromosome partitioning protein ParB [Desulfocucumis palustris]